MPVVIDGTNASTFPAATVSGTLEGTTITEGGVAVPRMVLSTAQNTTSGTNIDFTGIPSWVKRITVMLNGVSTNGTSIVQLQVGSGSVQTTGYLGSSISLINTANTTPTTNSTTGFYIGSGNTSYDSSASAVRTGQLVLCNVSGNAWTLGGAVTVTGVAQGTAVFSQGGVSLSGALDRLRLTTVGGTDTFDAGSVNIIYEG